MVRFSSRNHQGVHRDMVSPSLLDQMRWGQSFIKVQSESYQTCLAAGATWKEVVGAEVISLLQTARADEICDRYICDRYIGEPYLIDKKKFDLRFRHILRQICG